jgi:hypothetical protein
MLLINILIFEERTSRCPVAHYNVPLAELKISATE